MNIALPVLGNHSLKYKVWVPVFDDCAVAKLECLLSWRTGVLEERPFRSFGVSSLRIGKDVGKIIGMFDGTTEYYIMVKIIIMNILVYISSLRDEIVDVGLICAVHFRARMSSPTTISFQWCQDVL
jgi:hypothetical protein